MKYRWELREARNMGFTEENFLWLCCSFIENWPFHTRALKAQSPILNICCHLIALWHWRASQTSIFLSQNGAIDIYPRVSLKVNMCAKSTVSDIGQGHNTSSCVLYLQLLVCFVSKWWVLLSKPHLAGTQQENRKASYRSKYPPVLFLWVKSCGHSSPWESQGDLRCWLCGGCWLQGSQCCMPLLTHCITAMQGFKALSLLSLPLNLTPKHSPLVLLRS